jgi:pimeloyl-ACP methyl ester carboxylesterase
MNQGDAMPHLKVNDINMYYEIHGSGEPVVLVAGFSNDHSVWSGIVDMLKNDYQVIVFDNRGTGQTDVTDAPYSIEQMAADIAALCAGIGIRRAHFVGNSMGGYMLQALAYQHPQLVKSAVLSNTSQRAHCGYHIYAAAQLDMLKASVPLAIMVHASCGWAFSYRFLMQPGVMAQLVKTVLEAPYPFTIKGYEGQYAALDAFDSREWVGKIKVPVLVMSSEYDLIISEHAAEALMRAIPHAEYHCFKDCGHLPFLELPQQFVDVVRAFLQRHHD